jgi:putative lipoprotein (rSAM/lipoprotein system)
MPDEMLSPTNNYTLNGKVVSAVNEQSVISGVLIEICVEKSKPAIDSLYTDGKGLFEWTGPITTFGDNAKLTIAATDTTGKYKKHSMVIEFYANDISQEKNTWFLGEAEKSLTIKLQEKE